MARAAMHYFSTPFGRFRGGLITHTGLMRIGYFHFYASRHFDLLLLVEEVDCLEWLDRAEHKIFRYFFQKKTSARYC
jgi:hypothetical protein